LDELENDAYYLYYAQAGGNGKRYWFHTKPNINILINQAKSDIKVESIEAEIIKKIMEKYIQLFNILIDPSEDIREQQKPTLLILSPKYFLVDKELSKQASAIIEKLSTKKGSSERIYRNTLLFLLCSEVGISKLNADVRDYLACQKIYFEYHGQLEHNQKLEVRKRMEDAESKLLAL